jgi:hypothetical protein
VHFHICLGNHERSGIETLHDQVAWVLGGLESLGHEVTYSPTTLLDNAVNLLWENFGTELGEWLNRSSVRYGIVATEIPDGQGFNNRRDQTWRRRWHGFGLAAQRAEFIWCLVDEALPAYQHFATSAYLELGYTERLLPPGPRSKPTYDFSFAGEARDYRKTIIDGLSRQATVKYGGGLVGLDEQLRNLRMGRVGLALKQSAEWRWPSPARLGRLVHERIPVAAERTEVEIGVSRLVPKPAPGEDFVTWALARLDQDLEAEADAIFETYRAAMPMRTCMERALDLTLAVR